MYFPPFWIKGYSILFYSISILFLLSLFHESASDEKIQIVTSVPPILINIRPIMMFKLKGTLLLTHSSLTTDLALLLRDCCGSYFVLRCFAAFCTARWVKCMGMNV